MRLLRTLAPLFLLPAVGAAYELDTNKIRILQCMAAYEFDFVAAEFGFAITRTDDKGNEIQPPDDATFEKIRQAQLNHFMNTGKLTPMGPEKADKRGKKPAVSAKEREFAQRCQIIAETAIEVMLVRGQLTSPDNSTPRVLEQSL